MIVEVRIMEIFPMMGFLSNAMSEYDVNEAEIVEERIARAFIAPRGFSAPRTIDRSVMCSYCLRI